MAIFGRKADEEHSRASSESRDGQGGTDSRSYGIADLIRVLRTLPVDQHTELVLRVVKTTLESVNVQISDLIADASKLEEKLKERVATLHGKIQDLAKQIEVHHQDVSRLEAELAETTSARERLQLVEKSSVKPAVAASAAPPGRAHVPPAGR